MPFGYAQLTYATLPPAFYTKIAPEPVKSPALAIVNHALATSLNIAFDTVDETHLARLLSGTQLPSGITPLAQAYSGHQFGHFTQLGDGRAHLIAEHVTPSGQRIDIQLKGSGRTPYSRRGDGRAARGPMLREYLISEALHALGIPTTRSLAVVNTGDPVYRESVLPGAVLTRCAASHIRVGTFEYAMRLPDNNAVARLLAYTQHRHFPESQTALSVLKTVVDRQARLVANWMRVGFIHGVMNTDNMLVSGETIDYGPCAFMDNYHPNTVFSSIDDSGRYAYNNQPLIAQWNCARFADTLAAFIKPDDAQQAIYDFMPRYYQYWLIAMGGKLGLDSIIDGDAQLITDLLAFMAETHADFTLTFRNLATLADTFPSWYKSWQTRLSQSRLTQSESVARMNRMNPVIIPRNHHVESALVAAESGDMAPFNHLLTALHKPYSETADKTPYLMPPQHPDPTYRTVCGT